MAMSRLSTSTVSQSGSLRDRREARHRQHDEHRRQQQLVGHRVEPGADRRLLPREARDQAVERVGEGRDRERHQRPAGPRIQHAQREHRDEQQTQQRELIGGGEHGIVYLPASCSMRSMAATSSAPVTGRVGWKRLPSSVSMAPEATASAAAL